MKRIRSVRWVLVIQLNDDKDTGSGWQETALEGMDPGINLRTKPYFLTLNLKTPLSLNLTISF